MISQKKVFLEYEANNYFNRNKDFYIINGNDPVIRILDLYKIVPKKVLEIGPAEGAGLFMFRDFFPNALIYGLEIDQERVNKLQGIVGIQVYKCDQSNRSQLLDSLDDVLPGPMDLDLVIDDGSHKTSDQLFSFLCIWPKAEMYIIEDVHEPEALEEMINLYTEHQYDVEVKKVGQRYDDCLIIVRHKK